MSVVVAVRDEGQIWLAADSQVTQGYTKKLLLSSNSFKICKSPLNTNIGGVGSLRDMNILSTADIEFISERDVLKNEITFRSIVRDTVPAIFNELALHGRLYNDHEIRSMDSSFIIANGESCYEICCDGGVLELDDMFAIGSGGDAAESAYTILKDSGLSAKEIAIKCVMASCERDLFVNYPIIITSTKIDNFQYFDGYELFDISTEGEVVSLGMPFETECDCCNDEE